MNTDEPDPDGEVLLEVSYLEKDAKRLHAWAKTPGVSGDRDDAPDVDRRVWAANSLSGRECVGADVCNYGSQCFAALAKAKAQTADVVVTNHTLLAIEIVDSHPILPERDAVILDEAHEFMDRTTQAVTEELTSARVIRAAAMARKVSASLVWPRSLMNLSSCGVSARCGRENSTSPPKSGCPSRTSPSSSRSESEPTPAIAATPMMRQAKKMRKP
jgi:Rad3-related DNA helicase